MNNFIKVWLFWEAPGELRALSDNQGDEDYIMLVPPGWAGVWPDKYALEHTAFGLMEVEEHELPDGSMVYIGCHS